MTKRRIRVIPGEKYGALTIIREVESIKWHKYKKRMVLCECDCGQETIVRLEYLRNGHTQSCGCNRINISGKVNKTHGQSKTRLHGIWAGMLSRCRNENTKAYMYYGAKGVQVCEEWLCYEPFYNWAMANGYECDLTIDRRDPYGNYEPGNCRWIPKSEQIYTRRDMVGVKND